jgi:hypothetical protein
MKTAHASRTHATLAPALQALRGLRARHLAVALAASLLFTVLRGYYVAVLYVKGQAMLPKVPGLLLTGVALVLAVSIADAYVRRGARPIKAYGAAVFVSAVVTSIVNWYLTLALGGQNWFDPDVPLAVQRTEMLFTSVLQIVQSGFVVAAYLQWREREGMSRRLQASQLRRARDEQHMQQTNLRALQARIEPELLFAALHRVGELAETASARADRLLDDVIALLRLLMPGDVVVGNRLDATVEDELAIAVAYARVREGCDGATLDAADRPPTSTPELQHRP